MMKVSESSQKFNYMNMIGFDREAHKKYKRMERNFVVCELLFISYYNFLFIAARLLLNEYFYYYYVYSVNIQMRKGIG